MLRLTGGALRGRSIRTPHHLKTRPTSAKLRQALFNSLQTRIEGAKVLDLFAGSGALGFEALSRGASHCTFVEQIRSTAQLLEKNAAELGVRDQITLLTDSVDALRARIQDYGPFDIVLADPPYAAGWELKLILEWPWTEMLTNDGVFCLEWGKQKSVFSSLPDETPVLVKMREKNYGDSILTTYSRQEDGKYNS